MVKGKKMLVATIVALNIVTAAISQSSDAPIVGKYLPAFLLCDVYNFKKKSVESRDFLGKWLMIDFWTSTCTGCIKSFPKINEIQKKFSNRLQVLSIGHSGKSTYKTTKNLFQKYKYKYDLVFPVAFDSILFYRFLGNAVPYIIIVDPEGIVRGITSEVNETDMSGFLNGETPLLVKAERKDDYIGKGYIDSVPLLLNGNGGDEREFLTRTVLSGWDNSKPANQIVISKERLEAIGFDLRRMYNIAYAGWSNWGLGGGWADTLYGKFYSSPVLDMNDTSLFTPSLSTGKNMFCYSYCSKGNLDRETFFKSMRNDLNSFFHFDVAVELRKMPYYKLVASDLARTKLKTKGGRSQFGPKFGPHVGLQIRNAPIQLLVKQLWASYQGNLAIIDETGINSNIDLEIDAFTTDFDDLRKALKKNGLELIQGEKQMKVIVIRDMK